MTIFFLVGVKEIPTAEVFITNRAFKLIKSVEVGILKDLSIPVLLGNDVVEIAGPRTLITVSIHVERK